MKLVDINCDMGESYGPYTIGNDEKMMQFISSANIGCGWHGGDPMVMDRTVKMAAEHGVGVGSHPGYPDLMGFGRRVMTLSPAEVENYTLYQTGALYAFCKANGVELQHVKSHGALGNLAWVDADVARAFVRGVARFSRDLIVAVLPTTRLEEAAGELGLKMIYEGYPDRAYNPDGTLQSRKYPGSVIHDPKVAVERAVRMVAEGRVIAHSGESVSVKVNSLCIHGDNPNSPEVARQLVDALKAAGVEVAPMAKLI